MDAHAGHRQLILPERQAYQGAKSFYYCFLPVTMLIITVTRLYNEHITQSTTLWSASMILSYVVAVKLYVLCNQRDVTVKRVDEQCMLSRHTKQDLLEQSIKQIGSKQGQVQENRMMDQNMHAQCPDHSLVTNVGITHQRVENVSPHQNQKQNQISPQQKESKPLRYSCKKCKIVCPYRSKHCYKCSACVFRYDHHCFWIGNCVGYANHRQFYLFLLLQTINNICVMGSLLELESNIKQHVGLWVLLLIYVIGACTAGFILFTGYLLIYHTMLIVTGMTTWQHMSRQKITYLKYLPSGYNPFSKGVLTNIKQFWVHEEQMKMHKQYDVPTFQQAGKLEPVCSLIENQYYSCC